MTPKSPELRGLHGIIRTAPKSACNTHQGLTRSTGISREGLAMNATRPEPKEATEDPYAKIEGESAADRKKRLAREKTRRYRARLAGEEVPWHHISEKGGRKRALRMYPEIGPCSKCDADKAERHHIDANTANNHPSNIEVLCRRCHMETDGRLDAVIARPYRGIL